MLELDGSIIVVMILFAALSWAVGRMFLRPVGSLLQERRAATEGAFEEARQKMHQVDQEMRRYQQSLQQVRTENYRQQEERRREALVTRQQLLRGAHEKNDEVLTNARQQITAQVARAKEWIRKEAEFLSTEVVKQFLD